MSGNKKGKSPGTLGQRARARHNENHNNDTTNGPILQGVNGTCDSQNYVGWAERQTYLDQERARAWQDAVDKLSIVFEAGQGGGFPRVLVQAGGESDRLALLKRLGFKVLRHSEVNISIGSDGPLELVHCVDLAGGISANLTDGFVRTTIGGRGRE